MGDRRTTDDVDGLDATGADGDLLDVFDRVGDDEHDALNDLVEQAQQKPIGVSEALDVGDDDVEWTRDQAEYRLDTMADSGILEKGKVGTGRTSATAYWSSSAFQNSEE